MIRKSKRPEQLLRGVTKAQYYRVYRRILAGELTYKDAESQGLIGPKGARGPKRKPVAVVFRKSAKKRVKK